MVPHYQLLFGKHLRVHSSTHEVDDPSGCSYFKRCCKTWSIQTCLCTQARSCRRTLPVWTHTNLPPGPMNPSDGKSQSSQCSSNAKVIEIPSTCNSLHVQLMLHNVIVQFHRTTECLGLEGTLKITQFQPPAMGRDITHQIRSAKAPSSLALSTSRDGAATASVGNLFRCLAVENDFFLIPNLNLPSFSFLFLIILHTNFFLYHMDGIISIF